MCARADWFQSGSPKVVFFRFLPPVHFGEDNFWLWMTFVVFLALFLLHPFTVKLSGNVCACGNATCWGNAWTIFLERSLIAQSHCFQARHHRSQVAATSWLRKIQACFECVLGANTLGEQGRRDAGHPPDRRPESLALNLHCKPALSPTADSLSNDRHATYWIRFDSAGRMLYWFTVTTSRLQLTQLCHLCRPRLLSGMPPVITTGKYRLPLEKKLNLWRVFQHMPRKCTRLFHCTMKMK